MEAAERDVWIRSGAAKRRPRPCSASYIAVRDALYQLTRLSDFKSEKIGGGFYADVFRVTHKTTGEVLVLKMNKNSKFSRQMLSEIQLMNRLSHPNILRFKGSCVHEGQLHALTEYINGGSLEDLLHNRAISLSWSTRVKIALDIAKGMSYLHSRGVFHRDLSSRNCLIQMQPEGTMKCVVADFGLAAKIKQSRRRSHTEVVGSAYWMAPECLNGKEYCEQADVFSYGIVLAETATRLPADPDFMPRTRVYGMDFEALHKMCRNCPQDLWELMVRCCQIDPDERPKFDEAVRILERTRVPEDGERRREKEEELRTCFSEPLLRLPDSDDIGSYTSGQSSSSHVLPPIASSDFLLDNYSADSLSLGGHHLEQQQKQPVSAEDSKNDDVFEDMVSQETKQATIEQKPLAIFTTAPVENEGRMSYGLLESDEEGTNKVDSGIDPGEMFVAPVVSPGDVSGNQRSLSLCSEQDKSMRKEAAKRSSAEQYLTGGDTTPPCPHSPNSLQAVFVLGQPQSSETHMERTHPATAIAAPLMFRSPSNDLVPPTTPHRCCSPSTASDISLFVPNPSTPWAPPPSPLRSNSYRLSSSLPSSPTAQNNRQFRFSMDVQEALFPAFDPSIFSSPSVAAVNLRSTPKSDSKSKRRSLRYSCGHNTPLPTFLEDIETQDHSMFSTGEASFDRERFSTGSLQFPCRARSASNPMPLPPPPQPPHFTLNLARYSPCSHSHSTAGGSSAAFFKYYTIQPCLNCRLSSSEPNLVTRLSATHIV